MAGKKRMTFRKMNIWAQEDFLQSFKENLVSALIATVATTLFTLILAWGKRHFIDKPLLKIMLHCFYAFIPGNI